MEYYYKIYGLNIKSELEFPEAFEIEEQAADVEIIYGSMPDFIKEKQPHYNTSYSGKKYKWFYCEGQANFLIEDGIRITVELDHTYDEKYNRAMLLGPCLGTILYQRGIIAIHGSAVVYKDKAVIISGEPGAGKSTIAAELRRRGCLFLADDTVAITVDAGNIYAFPAYPQQKLCSDAAINCGYDLEKLTLLEEEREKYAIRLNHIFCPDKKEIAALLCLSVCPGEQLKIDEIKSSEKLELILSNMYAYGDYKYAGMAPEVFKSCVNLAKRIPILSATRPEAINVATQIVDRVFAFLDN